ncbi:MAG: winged helix-turn-helix domain-containing protein, partial [Brevinema sp.]
MAVPKFYEFCAPILHHLKDKDESISKKDLLDCIVKEMNISEEDQKETINSGMPKYSHRFGWALSHLKKAELIENVAKGIYQLSDQGKNFCTKNTNISWDAILEKTNLLLN